MALSVPRFEIVRRRAGSYGWRIRARNGEIIATSARQDFRSARDAERAARKVQETAPIAEIVEA